MSSGLFADDLDLFREGYELYKNHSYNQSLNLLRKISRQYTAYDYVYYLILKNCDRLNDPIYENLILKADDFISQDFPYFREIVETRKSVLLARKKYAEALELTRNYQSHGEFLLCELRIAVRTGVRNNVYGTLNLLLEEQDMELAKRALQSLGPFYSDCWKSVLSRNFFQFASALVGINSGKALEVIGKSDLSKADRNYLTALVEFHRDNIPASWEQVKTALNSKTQARFELMLDFLQVLKKKERKFCEYLPKIEPYLTESFFSQKEISDLYLETARIMLSSDSEKESLRLFKKAQGFAEKCHDAEHDAESLYNLAKCSFRYKNYQGASYFSKLFIAKYGNHKYAPEIYFLRYLLGKLLKDAEFVSSAADVLLTDYPETPYSYYILASGRKFRSESADALDTYQPQPVTAEMKKQKYYHLFKAGFVKEALDLIKKLPDEREIQVSLGYYRLVAAYSDSAVFYADLINKRAGTYKLDPALILAVIREESRFDFRAVSSAEAMGLMQIMDGTYSWLCKQLEIRKKGAQALLDPDLNVTLGSAYLKILEDRYSGYPEKLIYVIAAYNGGPGNVDKWIDRYGPENFLLFVPFSETKNYLAKVFKSYYNYRNPSE